MYLKKCLGGGGIIFWRQKQFVTDWIYHSRRLKTAALLVRVKMTHYYLLHFLIEGWTRKERWETENTRLSKTWHFIFPLCFNKTRDLTILASQYQADTWHLLSVWSSGLINNLFSYHSLWKLELKKISLLTKSLYKQEETESKYFWLSRS